MTNLRIHAPLGYSAGTWYRRTPPFSIRRPLHTVQVRSADKFRKDLDEDTGEPSAAPEEAGDSRLAAEMAFERLDAGSRTFAVAEAKA